MPPSPDDIKEHRENIDQAHAEEVRDAWMKAATQPREWPWRERTEAEKRDIAIIEAALIGPNGAECLQAFREAFMRAIDRVNPKCPYPTDDKC